VTFNYLNTYDWFRARVYKLEEEDHDVTDKEKALDKAFEWGDRIPIGVFYQEERPVYRDGLPQVSEMPLVKQKVKDVDISVLMEDFT
jgi:2-oxoglutarate ferredoxin oxidoreductase subunit beta